MRHQQDFSFRLTEHFSAVATSSLPTVYLGELTLPHLDLPFLPFLSALEKPVANCVISPFSQLNISFLLLLHPFPRPYLENLTLLHLNSPNHPHHVTLGKLWVN